MEPEQKEQTENNMIQIYKNFYPEENNVQDITYFPSMKFKPDGILMGYEEQGIYGVRKEIKEPILDSEDTKPVVVLDLYINNGSLKMATIRDGKIYFTPEYMQYLQQLNLAIYKVIDKQNGANLPSASYQEINLPNLEKLSKEELAQKIQLLEGKDLSEETLEEKTFLDEEIAIEEFAAKAGISLSAVKSCSSLDPTEKVTDEKSFEDITKTKGMYTKVFMVASNSQTKGNSRFAFWGVTPKGKVEQIEGLEEREGTNTGKEIYAINEDGSCVKEKQTTALFTLEGMKEGFSITIGQYGILEAEYLRKSPTENKYIGSSINTTHQRPTRKQVQEFMNDRKTNNQEIDESIEKAEEQLSVSPTTRIENIDDNPDNDVIQRQEDREILTPEEQALKNKGLL